MGQILSGYFGSGGSVNLNFADVQSPPDSDKVASDAFKEADATLQQHSASMDYLKTYTGNDAHVRKAMANPKDETARREAFEAMFPNVIAIKDFYSLSQSIDSAVANLLRAILRSDENVIETNQSLVVRLAQLFEGIFLFDWAKMTKPAIQNDFSFYRRELGKNSNASNVPVDDSEASAVSMFIAQSAPLLHSLTTSLITLAKKEAKVLPFLADFVNALGSNASSFKKGDGRGSEQQTTMLAMVIGIALFDRVDANGAFSKASPIEIRKCIVALKGWDNENRDSAISTLQYSTKTFNKAPNNVRRLFP